MDSGLPFGWVTGTDQTRFGRDLYIWLSLNSRSLAQGFEADFASVHVRFGVLFLILPTCDASTAGLVGLGRAQYL